MFRYPCANELGIDLMIIIAYILANTDVQQILTIKNGWPATAHCVINLINDIRRPQNTSSLCPHRLVKSYLIHISFSKTRMKLIII